MIPENRTLLNDAARDLGVTLDDRSTDLFDRLHLLLDEASDGMNLTTIRDEREVVLKHFVDSISCLRGGFLDGELGVLDLGTGAGFPALPLAIVRADLTLTPLDATRRKIDFVDRTARALGLKNVTPLVGRAETIGRQDAHRARYDRVVTRAVASLPVLVELALPLLRVGGLLVAQKGPGVAEELPDAEGAAAQVGGRIHEVQDFRLPVTNDRRHLVVVEKTHETPDRYPRREGVPTKHPLS
ncbi:16S rRNA (guanine(527)-N(7))-methyltransferase RsmG [Deinococcus pimensis]|uniref:16S rRNA (guanine(527)-N(7))-methyltransferase RsmG n=1 Tax=Deinococcus pimensis TaxID=309888 RepID=UPI000482C32A|nr:16S rRNA (guanine(527)-N(7))-methyltransferase RsmG [Deinococcus pimensis]